MQANSLTRDYDLYGAQSAEELGRLKQRAAQQLVDEYAERLRSLRGESERVQWVSDRRALQDQRIALAVTDLTLLRDELLASESLTDPPGNATQRDLDPEMDAAQKAQIPDAQRSDGGRAGVEPAEAALASGPSQQVHAIVTDTQAHSETMPWRDAGPPHARAVPADGAEEVLDQEMRRESEAGVSRQAHGESLGEHPAAPSADGLQSRGDGCEEAAAGEGSRSRSGEVSDLLGALRFADFDVAAAQRLLSESDEGEEAPQPQALEGRLMQASKTCVASALCAP
jgi:hypothetical protein